MSRNVIDNFETAMRRGGYETGYVVAFKFTRDAHEEVARAKSDGLSIELIKVQEVLLQVKRPGNVLARMAPDPRATSFPCRPCASRKTSPLPKS